jgi:hypothetical protein
MAFSVVMDVQKGNPDGGKKYPHAGPNRACSFAVFLTKQKHHAPKESQNMSEAKKSTPANTVWFEIPADNTARARKFCN